ncbi:hypothetical protein GPL26_16415 [Enterocloster citroniae]|uniref:Uncharacterized protein n=1 Tax=Enterocloster citroniae TaxID=358743 RepID=A0AA41K6Z5_9FIRM|nr:hypothetical protein [Enterocloster citroniae]MBT9811210.1 hypothetical protein [Enterocloster citroniae]
MSKADIQYMPLTTDPARYNHDLTTELTQANIWLAGGLDEERRRQRESEHWMMALAVMLAVTVTLLVLTWAGYITI